MAVTTREVTSGFRGSIYRNGQKLTGGQAWRCTRAVTRTDEGALDDDMEISVRQAVQYSLEVEELIINSAFSQQILEADAAGEDPEFLFIGESRRNDGQIERLKLDGAVLSSDLLLGGQTRGETRKRTVTLRLNRRPAFDSVIA